jgi:P4 family phage/plasmid primase-like protien
MTLLPTPDDADNIAPTDPFISEKLLAPDLTLLDAALALAEGGFKVVPLTSTPTPQAPGKDASKNPGGLLGKQWQNKTSNDPATLTAWFTQPDTSGPQNMADIAARASLYRHVDFDTMGIGVHAGPDIVIVDIDTPDCVPPQHWEELDRAPFQSSSSTDPQRGHYYFRRHTEAFFGHTSAINGVDGMASPGEIRHGTAIAVSAPSHHQKAHLGRRYQWQRAGVIPDMSDELADWLQSQKAKNNWNGNEFDVTEASLTSIDAFRDACTTASHPQILDDHLEFMKLQANIKGLHNTWLPGLIDLMQIALCGFVSAADAIDAAGDTFVDLRTDQSRGGNVGSEEDAQREYIDLLKWAVGKVQAKFGQSAPAVQFETYSQVSTYYGVEFSAPLTAPEGYVEPPPSVRGKRTWFHPKETYAEDGRILVKATHVDIANALAEDFAATHQWVSNGGASGEGEWWIYDGADSMVWVAGGLRVSVSAYVIHALATQYACYETIDAGKAVRAGAEQEMVDSLTALYGASPVYYRLTDRPGTHAPEINYISDMLKTRPQVISRRSEFDNTGSRIAVANGLLDVKTKAFEPSSPHHKTTKRMPVEYVAGATCPKFIEFLTNAVRKPGASAKEAHDIVGLIQRYFGAAILGDWSADSFLMAYGPGGSGKSTVFEDVPRALFGDESGYWSMITPAVFTRGISEAGRKFELASVAGTRFLTCNEAFDGNSHLDASFLKGFTDGSRQRAAFKGRDNFTMTPGRLVFMSNSLPKLNAVDSGISRRACVIEFPHAHDKSDPRLPDPDEQLFDRDILPELPGILNWVIAGAEAYLKDGLNPPVSVFVTTRDALQSSSSVGTFFQYLRPINEDDDQDLHNEFLSLKDLHNLLRDWLDMSEANGATPQNMPIEREFSAMLQTTFKTAIIKPRVHAYLDGGARTRVTPVYGLIANEELGAFYALRDGAAGKATPTGLWAGLSTAMPRTRIGIPEVEEWRQKNPGAAGTPIVATHSTTTTGGTPE